MKFLKRIGIGMLLGVVLLSFVSAALAQNLTDSVQAGRMTVLQVKLGAGQIYCLEAAGPRIVKFDNGAAPLTITAGGQRGGPGLLHAGDVIKVEYKNGGAHKIVVLRPAAAELESPEQ